MVVFFIYLLVSTFADKKQQNLYKIQEKYENIFRELRSKKEETHDFDMETNLEQFLESQIINN